MLFFKDMNKTLIDRNTYKLNIFSKIEIFLSNLRTSMTNCYKLYFFVGCHPHD